MLMSFGLFVFGIDTLSYEELQRRRNWRWAQTSRIGARPAHQSLGPGDNVVTLSGSVAAEVGDIASLDTLAELGDAGEALPLVDGTGRIFGLFGLEDLNERETHHFADGVPRLIRFDLTLRMIEESDGREDAQISGAR